MDAAVIAAQKAEARRAAFAVRKAAFSREDVAQNVIHANNHLLAVLALHRGKPVAGYMPMRSEIDPLPAMHAHDGPLCVPVIMAPATPLRFAAYFAGCRMQDGEFGARIPAVMQFITPQVLIVPLLAFDPRGYRLGYGGGFYDRTLQRLRGQGPVMAIGFAFAAQEVAFVPTDDTDQPLDMIITDNGVRLG